MSFHVFLCNVHLVQMLVHVSLSLGVYHETWLPLNLGVMVHIQLEGIHSEPVEVLM